MQIQSLPNMTRTIPTKAAAAPKETNAGNESSEVSNTNETVSISAAAPQRSSHKLLKAAGIAAAFGGALALMPGIASAATVASAAAPAAAEAVAPAATQAATQAAASIPWGTIAIGGAVAVGFGFMVYNMMKNAGGGGGLTDLGDNDSGATAAKSNKTFADVAGATEAKASLMETVDFLKNPDKYKKMGAKPPRGVLLSGPPGTGKTLLAKAVAGEAKVNFLEINGSAFEEKLVGVGASRVRALFKEAREKAPCVVFIDEIDAIGGKRDGGLGQNTHIQTLNALLSQMDGFATDEGVVVLAATNRPDSLDSALVRSGRFDRKVTVDRPNAEARLAILNVHARNKPIENKEDLKFIADRTTGLVGADLENIMNEAAISAVRQGKEKISLQMMSEAIDTVVMGPQLKSKVLSPEEREYTAYHEAGHAILSVALPSNGDLQKVTILPRGQAAGVTWTVPTDNKSMYKESELLDRIAMLMAGRAAEDLKFDGKIATGASNDIERATDIAKGMVMTYGMTELGQVKFSDPNARDAGLAVSDTQNKAINDKVVSILDEQYDRAKDIIKKNEGKWTELSVGLLAKEEIDKPELDAMLKGQVHA